MTQSLAALYCHIVFSTKSREPLIAREMEDRIFAFIGGVMRQRKGSLLAGGGMTDHVHLLVSMGREWAVSDLVRDIKSNSSGWVHDSFSDMAHFAWQAGYGAFSVSASQLSLVKHYIANQKVHHATQSFQEEFRQFLTRHELEYDER